MYKECIIKKSYYAAMHEQILLLPYGYTSISPKQINI